MPAISSNGQAFRRSQYQSDLVETGLDRTREGYVELIEMGVVEDGDLKDALSHNSGSFNCSVIQDAWQTGGTWQQDSNTDMSAPTGGLYGTGVLINPVPGYRRHV
ncbi:MAG: hypothetical protein U5L11_00380 [Arhodomonas sp.]|nr:hypothetical protein [Arhodomonas sp.]